MPIRVAASGTGNMCRQALQAVGSAEDLAVAGVLEKFSGEPTYTLPGGQTVPQRPRVADQAELQADVLVDFTNAAWTQELLPVAIAAGGHPVVGTTGLPDAFVAEMQRQAAARGLGGVIASNYALGAVLM